ncbi:alkaline phosphatase family protein [Archangium sp.]|uniref:alkaline phosphatase family protein n=1 Tax=Archangium sp. TaxID=1872627 RepID=UPI002D3823A0|nr:alkaline phosphatase family protein [Archangium sp.]HYO54927.1 alkaline phosphatase family protein [Archangium sp.]
MAALDEIQTIVILMQENRSFDHMLGHLSLEGLLPDVDGLRQEDMELTTYANEYRNRFYWPFLIQDEASVIRDPPHSRHLVQVQMARSSSGKKFRMSGFVDSYIQYTQHQTEHPPPMGYFDSRGAWMTSFLARQYCVCDRWFTPLPSDTQPNRCMAFTGTTLIDDTDSRLIPHREHVFDWLNARGVRWRVYHDGPPFFLLFGRFHELVGMKYRPFSELAHDIQHEDPGQAPQVIFLEPRYFDFFWSDEPANCNHPLALVCHGERLLHRVYTALTCNPEKWARTLFIHTYDEHGGFFDHVPPLPIENPPPPGADFTEGFKTTGPRVPGLLVSPWVQPGKAFHGNLDHTSMLQLLAEKFGSGPEDYSASVNHRRAQRIRSLSEALADAPALRPIPTRAPEPCPPMPSMKRQPRAPNERAFQKAALELLQHEGPIATAAKYPDLVGAPLTP